MKIAIDCVHYPISPRASSHRSSWARYWKWYLEQAFAVPNGETIEVDILKRGEEDRWQDYDRICFYQGMEYEEGVLNLAGGFADWMKPRFLKYAEAVENKTVMSLDVAMPDYYELLKKRGVEIPELKGVHEKVRIEELPKMGKIVLGDSHALSVMDSPDGEFVTVYRTDFKTLNGALKLGLKNVRPEINWKNVHEVTLFFGMIDLRHHVMRFGGFPAIDSLMERYEEQIRELLDEKIKVELVEMYPMTKNDRKLPKSGFYEGQPFAGTIEERIGAVDYFNEKLKDIADRLGLGFYKHPEIFTDPTDNTMDEFFMEKPRSVHMSTEFYRFDLEAGKTREW